MLEEVLQYFRNYHTALYDYHKSLELDFYNPDTSEEAMSLFFLTVEDYQKEIKEVTLFDVLERKSDELFKLKVHRT